MTDLKTPPDRLKSTKGITVIKEPYHLKPGHIGPVLWMAAFLIICITLVAALIAVETNGAASASFVILGLSLVGAWSAILAFLGKNSDTGWFKAFSKRKSKDDDN